MTTVWIVDDDLEMRQAIRLMLQVIGCESVPYGDARSTARALLAGQSPDLLLLDINMPEVNGLDLLEFVRRRREWQALPVLMLSTEAADVTIDRAMALGADGYVVKPATMEELQRALDKALHQTRKGAL